MPFKIKTVDKLERVVSGPLLSYQATVTFSDGVKDIQRTIISAPINPKGQTDKDVDDFLKADICKVIEQAIHALDAQAVEDSKLSIVKDTVFSALTSAGLTIAMLLCLLIAPITARADGDLVPTWTTWTALGTNVTELGQAGSTHLVGQIDMSNYYMVQIVVNWDENGDNPADTAGVSLYCTSGTTDGYIPDAQIEITAADYAKFCNADGSGVTKSFPNFENIPIIGVGIAKQTTVDANNVFNVYYRLGKGRYESD